MKAVVHKAKNFQEAEAWDIEQQIQMSPHERQRVAKILRERFYGKACPDVRSRRNK